jgi:hypothetical protein
VLEYAPDTLWTTEPPKDAVDKVQFCEGVEQGARAEGTRVGRTVLFSAIYERRWALTKSAASPQPESSGG